MLAAGLIVTLLAAAVTACGGDNGPSPKSLSPEARAGQQLAGRLGCSGCHGAGGGGGLGPPFKGLWQKRVKLRDGSTVVADAAYIRRSILQPEAQVVAGYGAVMPAFDPSDKEIAEITAYIEALK